MPVALVVLPLFVQDKELAVVVVASAFWLVVVVVVGLVVVVLLLPVVVVVVAAAVEEVGFLRIPRRLLAGYSQRKERR